MKLKRLSYIFFFFLLAGTVFQFSSCKKEILFSEKHLAFSADTVFFDTVFTTVGSTTKRLKIYNTSDKPLKIESVILEGGKNSSFRINFDGISGTNFKNETILANDSLFVFVEVTLDPNNQNDPLIIEDKILFQTNGKEQSVQLVAWGQDAYFYRNEYVEGVWSNDKPHVIYDLAVVDSLKTLTIEAGTKVYLHKNAILYIDGGKLLVEGNEFEKVEFQGDRLEAFYDDVKGQYYGIYFDHALSSKIEHAIIKNGTAGIHVFGDSPQNTDYTLTLNSTEIANHSSYGIFNYSGGRIYGQNVNLHSNGVYAFFLLEGGDYNFRHSQFLSHGSEENQPAVAIKNYFTRSDGITYIGNVNEGAIYNSIIYGGGEYQFGFDTITGGGAVSVNYDFNNNLIKQKEVPFHTAFVNNIWNQDPKFEDTENKKFKITSGSPCENTGNSAFAVEKDIEGNWRSMGTPDIGAYEIE